MNKPSILLLFTLCLTLPMLGVAQGLSMVYNAQTGKVSYFESGQEIPAPRVKKGQSITLRVEQYNNYIYQADITESHEKINPGTGDMPLGGLQGLGFANISDLITSPGFTIDTDAGEVADFLENEKNLSAEERLILQLATNAESKLEQINDLEKDFQEILQDIKAFEKKERFKAITMSEVEKIKMNPMLPPAKIKTFSKEIIEKALEIRSTPAPTLASVISNNDPANDLQQLMSKQETARSNYESSIGQLDALKRELYRLAPGRADLATLYFSMEITAQSAPDVLENAGGTSQKLGALLEAAEGQSLAETLAIWYEYEAIGANDFSTTYLSQGYDDLVVFNVSLQRKETAQASGAQETVRFAPIQVPVYGGMKINASVGINFGRLFSRAQSYTVRDSVILGQNEDNFQPMVASNLHFYRQGRGNLSVGGSLGIGLPIGSDTGFQSINFFMGPSLFFGQSERLVLNFGLMGGKSKRLSEGYAAGDAFEDETVALPFHYPYELGAFIGLSFNLGKSGG